MIQTSGVFKVGSGGNFNTLGAWVVLIPTVDATSRWCSIYMNSSIDPLSGNSTINLELGIGNPGTELRKWRSVANFGGGSNLEFDDSYWSNYLPFTFRRGDIVSGRIAGLISVAVAIELQVQLHS